MTSIWSVYCVCRTGVSSGVLSLNAIRSRRATFFWYWRIESEI